MIFGSSIDTKCGYQILGTKMCNEGRISYILKTYFKHQFINLSVINQWTALCLTKQKNVYTNTDISALGQHQLIISANRYILVGPYHMYGSGLQGGNCPLPLLRQTLLLCVPAGKNPLCAPSVAAHAHTKWVTGARRGS